MIRSKANGKPAGRKIIAQRFIAGYTARKTRPVPPGTKEPLRPGRASFSPLAGLEIHANVHYPPLKRRAILGRPCGTGCVLAFERSVVSFSWLWGAARPASGATTTQVRDRSGICSEALWPPPPWEVPGCHLPLGTSSLPLILDRFTGADQATGPPDPGTPGAVVRVRKVRMNRFPTLSEPRAAASTRPSPAGPLPSRRGPPTGPWRAPGSAGRCPPGPPRAARPGPGCARRSASRRARR